MVTLILVDVLDSHGKIISRQRLPLASSEPPLVIGRDVACDIIVNDPYAAARHAALSLDEDGTVRVGDLNTVNGLIVEGERVKQATLDGLLNGQVQIGHSHLRIRVATAVLAPERPDLESLRSKHREYGVLIASAFLCIGFATFSAWLGSPDNEPIAVATHLLQGALVLGTWFAFWVLLGRSIRSRWQWSGNAAITLGAAATWLWGKWATGVTVFATGLPFAAWFGEVFGVLIVGVAIYLHVRIATRLRRQQAAAIACLLPLLSVSAYLWFMSQRNAEDVNYIIPIGKIYPPSWSQQRGMRPERFFDESMELRDLADQKRAAGQLPEPANSGAR